MGSAFRDAPHGSGNEAAIVDGLREGGALTISLIAEDENELVGHVAFSLVKINAEAVDWYGLGPIAVRPDKQRRGIGRVLIESGLDCIRSLHARGCVVLGDPAHYGRFGFRSDPALRNTRVPAEYLQQLSFGDEKLRGIVESPGILRKVKSASQIPKFKLRRYLGALDAATGRSVLPLSGGWIVVVE